MTNIKNKSLEYLKFFYHFLKKEHKISTLAIILAIVIAGQGLEGQGFFNSMMALAILLSGMNESSKKYLFNWAEPLSRFMPILLPLMIYLLFK